MQKITLTKNVAVNKSQNENILFYNMVRMNRKKTQKKSLEMRKNEMLTSVQDVFCRDTR